MSGDRPGHVDRLDDQDGHEGAQGDDDRGGRDAEDLVEGAEAVAPLVEAEGEPQQDLHDRTHGSDRQRRGEGTLGGLGVVAQEGGERGGHEPGEGVPAGLGRAAAPAGALGGPSAGHRLPVPECRAGVSHKSPDLALPCLRARRVPTAAR